MAILQVGLVGALFLFPILRWRLDPEINNYLSKLTKKLGVF
jgi:hypothetical protein